MKIGKTCYYRDTDEIFVMPSCFTATKRRISLNPDQKHLIETELTRKLTVETSATEQSKLPKRLRHNIKRLKLGERDEGRTQYIQQWPLYP
jgi:hypothetical protein